MPSPAPANTPRDKGPKTESDKDTAENGANGYSGFGAAGEAPRLEGRPGENVRHPECYSADQGKGRPNRIKRRPLRIRWVGLRWIEGEAAGGPALKTRLSWGVSGGQAMSCAAIEREVRWRRLQRAEAASVME